jgi:four helix bundle protein
MRRFTEIKSWQKGHTLVLAVYRMTTGFPVSEKFGLTSQLRRAALSVPTKYRGRLEANWPAGVLPFLEYFRSVTRGD